MLMVKLMTTENLMEGEEDADYVINKMKLNEVSGKKITLLKGLNVQYAFKLLGAHLVTRDPLTFLVMSDID